MEQSLIIRFSGAGKSHFFELAAQEALANNFIVATTSLDLREVPPNRPQRIYLSLMRSLRFPDSAEVGLTPLLEKIIAQPNYSEIQDSIRETFFATALHNYLLMRDTPDNALDELVDWMSGEKVFISDVRRNLLSLRARKRRSRQKKPDESKRDGRLKPCVTGLFRRNASAN